MDPDNTKTDAVAEQQDDVELKMEAGVQESSEDSTDEDLKKQPVDENVKYSHIGYDPEKFPFREWTIDVGLSEPLNFNPVVSGFGIICLWGIAIWSMGK